MLIKQTSYKLGVFKHINLKRMAKTGIKLISSIYTCIGVEFGGIFLKLGKFLYINENSSACSILLKAAA